LELVADSPASLVADSVILIAGEQKLDAKFLFQQGMNGNILKGYMVINFILLVVIG
jgi:hypothetical protein